MRTACTAMNKEESTPYKMDNALGEERQWRDSADRGATPRRKPVVTTPAATITRREGILRVEMQETAMVRGRTMPLAIYSGQSKRIAGGRRGQKIPTWKKEASTPLKQRILKTKPITLTRVTGVTFFAVWKSSRGISTFGERKDAI